MTIWNDGNNRFSASTLPFVGRAVVAVLTHPNETANKNVYVRSFTTSGNALLGVLAQVTGKHWTVNYTTGVKERQEGRDRMKNGDQEGVWRIVRSFLHEPNYGSDFDAHEHVWNRVLGLPDEEDLNSAVREVLQGRNQ